MKAYVFPGQGAQFPSMGQALYEQSAHAKELFEQANTILNFRITDIMFEGTEAELQQTNVTQPAIFLHSVITAMTSEHFEPQMVAGHSLGEFSALVSARAINFEDGLKLVATRAQAMQKACEQNPSTMAAILGLADEVVAEVCTNIFAKSKEVVVPANYNSPQQVVISGSLKGIEMACEQLKSVGAKRAITLKVGGAFHSPLMESARTELAETIEKTQFQTPICPIYQNVDAQPHTDSVEIKQNLVAQLTSPVRWTQTMQNMIADGASEFTECGPGKVLRGLVKKINRKMPVSAL